MHTPFLFSLVAKFRAFKNSWKYKPFFFQGIILPPYFCLAFSFAYLYRKNTCTPSFIISPYLCLLYTCTKPLITAFLYHILPWLSIGLQFYTFFYLYSKYILHSFPLKLPSHFSFYFYTPTRTFRVARITFCHLFSPFPPFLSLHTHTHGAGNTTKTINQDWTNPIFSLPLIFPWHGESRGWSRFV